MHHPCPAVCVCVAYIAVAIYTSCCALQVLLSTAVMCVLNCIFVCHCCVSTSHFGMCECNESMSAQQGNSVMCFCCNLPILISMRRYGWLQPTPALTAAQQCCQGYFWHAVALPSKSDLMCETWSGCIYSFPDQHFGFAYDSLQRCCPTAPRQQIIRLNSY